MSFFEIKKIPKINLNFFFVFAKLAFLRSDMIYVEIS